MRDDLEELTLKKKVVLLGDSAVGKTSMVRRFVEDRYDDRYISTIGAKVSKKTVHFYQGLAKVEIDMVIWDLIGSQGYESTQAKHIAGASCALLVHDLARTETFHSLENYWIPLVYKVTSGIPPPMMITGNKSDLVEQGMPDEKDIITELMSSEDSGEIMREIYPTSVAWKPTSAKTGENVEECFYIMAWMMYHSHWKTRHNLGSISDGLARAVVDDMVRHGERASLLSLADLIMVELPELGPPEMATAILEDCFSEFDFDKDAPGAEPLRQVIECTKAKALGLGFERQGLEEAVEKWREIWKKIVKEEQVSGSSI